VGLTWHLSRHFAFQLDGRFLTGLPHYGAVVEGGLSAQLAFGGVKGPAQPAEEAGEEEEEDVISDEPPTSDLGLEEEEE
jgi:hypothetical protein